MLGFIAVFAIVCVAHIVFISLGKRTARRVSKVLLIPALLAAYIASGTQLFFPIPALVLGWIGDVILIRKDKKIFFLLGLIAFLLGHIFYIISFIECLERLSIGTLIFSLPLAIVFGTIAFRIIKPPKGTILPVIIYMIVLETVALLGLQVFASGFNFAGALIFFGCLLFMVSDLILSYYAFRMVKRLGAVFVMVFYILAQAGIILGLIYLPQP